MFISWNKSRAIEVAQENANAAEVPFVVYQKRESDGGWSAFLLERKSVYDKSVQSPSTRVVKVVQPQQEVKP